MMGCSLKKVGNLLAELDSRKGIGLITRIRQGLGRPDRIYVRKCTQQDMYKRNIQTRQNDISGNVKMTGTDMSEMPGNDTEDNKTEISDTDRSDTEYLSFYSEESEEMHRKRMEREVYHQMILNNIGYEYLVDVYNRDMLNEIVELIVDTVCSEQEMIRIGGDRKPKDVVKSQFLKLNSEHIRFVLKCLKENTSKVINIRQYLLTVLYNAPLTISNYYSALVQHDMYGIRCGKVTANLLKAAMKKALVKMEQEKQKLKGQKQPKQDKEDKTYKGKQSMDKLMKQNVQLSNIEITDGNIKSFERVAKKYSIDFSLKKDVNADPPRYYVFFKARDADVMTAAFKEYTGQSLNKDKKPSVRKKLQQAISKSLKKHRELEKTKGKEKEPSL